MKNYKELDDELLALIYQFGEFGKTSDGGINRLALSDQDKKARDHLCSWLTDNNFSVQIDVVGNIFGVFKIKDALSDKVFISGSHLDSQPNGGLYDGTVGVAMACVMGSFLQNEIKNGNRKSLYGYYIIACWTSEEGARFQPSLLGSSVFVGNKNLKDALNIKDKDGVLFNDALNEIGYAGKNVDFKPSQYFEVHIEQGKLLEAKKAAVGIVSNSWGARKLKILIKGKPDHTGPTPMDIRSDALLLASRIIIKVNEIAILSNGTLHSSVGRMDLSPNSPNTVVEEAKLWIEFRGANDLELDQAEAKINEFMTMNHLASNCDIQQISRDVREAVKFDELAFTRICVALKRNNINYLEMTTVAGHDALQLQSYCPSTLIFIPSKDGISHSPDEYTSDTDILNGYNASLIALSELFFEDN